MTLDEHIILILQHSEKYKVSIQKYLFKTLTWTHPTSSLSSENATL